MNPQIEILLAEYGTLRAAILQRQTHILQTWGATVTAFIATLALPSSVAWKRGLVVIVIVAGGVTLKALMRFTRQNARRVAQIEAAINGLAKSHLLDWELNWGPYIWDRAFPNLSRLCRLGWARLTRSTPAQIPPLPN